MSPPPKSLSLPVISRVKVIADLNIAEHRIPQDGRIKMTIEGRAVDLRVSTLSLNLVKVLCACVGQVGSQPCLDSLGLPEDVKGESVRKTPQWYLYCDGPTGSGKTTTLYSALKEVNEMDTKLLTAEDPVEYEIEGIMQCRLIIRLVLILPVLYEPSSTGSRQNYGR